MIAWVDARLKFWARGGGEGGASTHVIAAMMSAGVIVQRSKLQNIPIDDWANEADRWVSRLDEAQRELVDLHYRSGKDYGDIMRGLGFSRKAYYARIHKVHVAIEQMQFADQREAMAIRDDYKRRSAR
jgi:hypothetical protein